MPRPVLAGAHAVNAGAVGGVVVCDGGMVVTSGRPGVDGLGELVGVLREWQRDDGPLQLHPGDLGWFWRFGAEATAAAVRTWSRDGRIVAVGLLDGPTVLRLTTGPDARRDEELARRLVEDLDRPERNVLPAGEVNVEAPSGSLLPELLTDAGWEVDEPWTPLRRDLRAPVPDPGVRVEVVTPERASVWAGVLRASFDGSTFAEERWHAMAAGGPYGEARSLIAYDGDDAVGVATVWSAGPGQPGLLEPLGVHRDHRGRGHGRAISVAAAAALQELGSSVAEVCTPSDNVGAVATYESAGFHPLDQRLDRRRPAGGVAPGAAG